jgi:uncharacterized protein YbjT (DUF2867 family)
MAFHRVTVFGGSGFIGRHIVQRLARQGAIVRAAVRDPEAALFLKPMGAVGQVVPVFADVRDEASVKAAIAGADAVVNAVGLYAPSRRYSYQGVHVEGAARVARHAAAAGARMLVHLSGLGADPASSSAYVAARGHGDVEVRAAFPAASLLRPSVVFGPGDHALTMIAVAARLMPALPLFGGGTAKVQPVYVGDVADAALACLAAPSAAAGHVFELGGPTVYTYRALYEAVLAAIGRKRWLVKTPMALGRIMAFFAGVLPNPPITRDALALMAVDNVVSPGAKDLATLGIRPTALELILPTYMDQYRRGGRWRNTRFA